MRPKENPEGGEHEPRRPIFWYFSLELNAGITYFSFSKFLFSCCNKHILKIKSCTPEKQKSAPLSVTQRDVLGERVQGKLSAHAHQSERINTQDVNFNRLKTKQCGCQFCESREENE